MLFYIKYLHKMLFFYTRLLKQETSDFLKILETAWVIHFLFIWLKPPALFYIAGFKGLVIQRRGNRRKNKQASAKLY